MTFFKNGRPDSHISAPKWDAIRQCMKYEVWVNYECVTCYSKAEAVKTQKRMIKRYAD